MANFNKFFEKIGKGIGATIVAASKAKDIIKKKIKETVQKDKVVKNIVEENRKRAKVIKAAESRGKKIQNPFKVEVEDTISNPNSIGKEVTNKSTYKGVKTEGEEIEKEMLDEWYTALDNQDKNQIMRFLHDHRIIRDNSMYYEDYIKDNYDYIMENIDEIDARVKHYAEEQRKNADAQYTHLESVLANFGV